MYGRNRAGTGPLVFVAFLRLPMAPYGFVLLPTVVLASTFNGFLWLPMTSYDSSWLPMASYGLPPSCVQIKMHKRAFKDPFKTQSQ